MQRHLITVLTLLLIGAGVWFAARNRPADFGGAMSTPEDAIQAMLDASRRGDARAYLDCFTDALRPQLDATRQQMGEARFREYLMESQAPVMGVATTRLADARPDRARCEVEFILRDKNQRQTIEMKNESGRWRIEAMSHAVYARPPIPYGTKVFEEPKAKTNAPSSRVSPNVNG
ncbi:MAG: hypothetical protein NTY01_17430 [Verrucomicrobia bacterium]|nr:hypothetical protein [Verrucomicrobiota bacterium]